MSKPRNSQQRIERALEHCVNFNFRRIARKLAARYDSVFHDLDLKTTQYSLLAAIRMAEEPTLADLCEGMALERTTLLRNLAPLEKRRLIESAGKERGQQRRVRLTAAGKDLLAKAFSKWREAQRETISDIGAEEWQKVSQSLKGINARI